MTGGDTLRDITLGGYHIPKGTVIFLNLARIYHDENEWLQPGEFKPERFLDDERNFWGGQIITLLCHLDLFVENVLVADSQK